VNFDHTAKGVGTKGVMGRGGMALSFSYKTGPSVTLASKSKGENSVLFAHCVTTAALFLTQNMHQIVCLLTPLGSLQRSSDPLAVSVGGPREREEKERRGKEKREREREKKGEGRRKGEGDASNLRTVPTPLQTD